MATKIVIWQIGIEGKKAVRAGIKGLSIEEEMDGHLPMHLYKEVAQFDMTFYDFERVKADPFFNLNRHGLGGYLEAYEAEFGQVPMWSLSVGDIIHYVDGEEITAQRVEPMGWEDVTEKLKALLNPQG